MRFLPVAVALLFLLGGCADPPDDDDATDDDDDATDDDDDDSADDDDDDSADDDDDDSADDDDDDSADDDDDSGPVDSDGDGDPDVTDCDDLDDTVYTGAPEVWYDGVDSDCGGDDDYDQDGDGDPAEAYGGTDCDDLDDTVSGCRPPAGCTSPDPTTLDLYDPPSVVDLVFNDNCEAVVSTIVSGTDSVYVIDTAGVVSVTNGFSNHDISSIALDPLTGSFVAGYSSTQAVGYGDPTVGLPVLVNSGAGYLRYNDGPWLNPYWDMAPTAIEMDTAGCVWVPNWAAEGDLACVDLAGTVTIVGSYGAPIEALALGPDETLYIAIDDTISMVNTTTGALTTHHVAGGTVLDFAVDWNNDIYLEATTETIDLVPGDGGPASVFVAVADDGKLAIAPDGWLIRVRPDTIGALGPSAYERYDLGP